MTVKQGRSKVREVFESNLGVKDIRVIDMLVVKVCLENLIQIFCYFEEHFSSAFTFQKIATIETAIKINLKFLTVRAKRIFSQPRLLLNISLIIQLL